MNKAIFFPNEFSHGFMTLKSDVRASITSNINGGYRAQVKNDKARDFDEEDEVLLMKQLAKHVLGTVLFSDQNKAVISVLNNILLDCPMSVLSKYLSFEVFDSKHGRSAIIGDNEYVAWGADWYERQPVKDNAEEYARVKNEMEISTLNDCIVYLVRTRKVFHDR